MKIAELRRATELASKLDKLDRKRSKILRELAALGIDTDEPAPAAVAAEIPVYGLKIERREAVRMVEPQQAAAPQLSSAEIEEKAIKAVLAGPYAAWKRGEIDDDDFNARKDRYKPEIDGAKQAILAGPPDPDVCQICDGPADVTVMGEKFCNEHRPKPVQVVAA